MNFAEGVKRVYVVLSCLVLLIYLVVQFEDRPSVANHAWKTYDALRDAYAAAEKKNRYDIDWGKQTAFEFSEQICKPPLKWVLDDVNVICQKYIDAKNGLTKEVAYHAASSLGWAALIALGSSLLWMLLAWIGRRCVQKKP